MRRSHIALAVVALVVGGLPTPATAAMEVVVAVSPAEAAVCREVEVLVRTFAPFPSADLGLPAGVPYPAPSGMWLVLYPYPDYPFDVLATSDRQAAMTIPVVLDPGDATLWRGSFAPTHPGWWTVTVRDFRPGEPGASVSFQVVPADPRAESCADASPTP